MRCFELKVKGCREGKEYEMETGLMRKAQYNLAYVVLSRLFGTLSWGLSWGLLRCLP